ncbi:uncharacterized protein LOC130636441 [Hydractinia symbiolongicarpus]|uniref:uncharacterized protein LOC130636441 n=1 Tax=Hydractinia symbiolongicarpus TaxID=13093 RepID=UPI00254B3289|nr:uncharacterized protein LOC130636441 [Hydractinia symbiolongicarpus]
MANVDIKTKWFFRIVILIIFLIHILLYAAALLYIRYDDTDKKLIDYGVKDITIYIIYAKIGVDVLVIFLSWAPFAKKTFVVCILFFLIESSLAGAILGIYFAEWDAEKVTDDVVAVIFLIVQNAFIILADFIGLYCCFRFIRRSAEIQMQTPSSQNGTEIPSSTLTGIHNITVKIDSAIDAEDSEYDRLDDVFPPPPSILDFQASPNERIPNDRFLNATPNDGFDSVSENSFTSDDGIDPYQSSPVVNGVTLDSNYNNNENNDRWFNFNTSDRRTSYENVELTNMSGEQRQLRSNSEGEMLNELRRYKRNHLESTPYAQGSNSTQKREKEEDNIYGNLGINNNTSSDVYRTTPLNTSHTEQNYRHTHNYEKNSEGFNTSSQHTLSGRRTSYENVEFRNMSEEHTRDLRSSSDAYYLKELRQYKKTNLLPTFYSQSDNSTQGQVKEQDNIYGNLDLDGAEYSRKLKPLPRIPLFYNEDSTA